MYGRFSREVRPDDAVDDPETFINEAATASFLRTGYAAKFGLGTRESYVDFVYLNAADQQPAEYDYSEWEMHPAQNVVLGIRSVINAKGLVVITNDWAARVPIPAISLLTVLKLKTPLFARSPKICSPRIKVPSSGLPASQPSP